MAFGSLRIVCEAMMWPLLKLLMSVKDSGLLLVPLRSAWEPSPHQNVPVAVSAVSLLCFAIIFNSVPHKAPKKLAIDVSMP